MVDQAHIRRHFEETLAFWSRARDHQAGGYHCYVRADGTIHESPHRPVLIQARLLYNFSEGVRFGVDGCREQADHLYGYLRERLYCPDGWYGSIRGDQLVGDAVLDVYSNSFVALALARYGLATGSQEATAEGRRLLNLIIERCAGPDIARDGIFGHSDAPVAADRMARRAGGVLMGRHSGNAMLHFTEAVVRLYDAGERVGLVDLLNQLRTFFLDRLYDHDLHVIYDHFNGGYDQPYRFSPSSMGHALEWIDFFRSVPDCQLPETVERDIFDKSAGAVLDNGLFLAEYYHPEQRFGGVIDFWVQVEAVKAFNLGHTIYGGDLAAIGRRCLDAWFRYFVAPDGGSYEVVDQNGVVLKRSKGGWWKCDYHNVRMCVDLLERPCGILEPQAVG